MIEISKVKSETKYSIDELVGADTKGFAALGGGFSFVGPMTLPTQTDWAHFSPGAGWPYYSPSLNPGGLVENPAHH